MMNKHIGISTPSLYTGACVGLELLAILLTFGNGCIFWTNDVDFIRILSVFFTCIFIKRIIPLYEKCWMLSNLFNSSLGDDIEVDVALNIPAVTVFMLSKKSKFVFRILACWIPVFMIYIISGYKILYTNYIVLITSMCALILIGVIVFLYIKRCRTNFISYCKECGIKKITLAFVDEEEE